MEKNKQYLSIGLIVYILGILLSSIVLFTQGIKMLTWAILIISLIYLVMGLFIFKKFYPEGHLLLLFFMGYLYAGVFIAVVFFNTGWPLAKTFIGMAPVWAIIQMIIVLFVRKQLLKNIFIRLILESIILLILAIVMLIIEL
jgi:hypothetical protein